MKVYKALKLKNLLVGEIFELITKIRDNNSLIKGNPKIYDINELYDELLKKQVKLINIKVALQITNSPVYKKIFRLSELKSLIIHLKDIPANEGKHTGLYSRDEIVKYECTWNNKQIDGKISSFKKEISKLQDELEQFNFTTDLKGYVEEN